MSIKLVPDVGAPVFVFAADWASSTYDEKATGFKLNRPIGIALAFAGYAGGMFNFGGDFVKNIGIASFDWAANSIVGYIKERTAPVSAGGRVARVAIPVRSSMGTSELAGHSLQRTYQPEMERASAF